MTSIHVPPLVTVVIPTYNYADKIGRAISGVSTQTISNFECYIIDDGSTDNTEEVVNEIIQHDLRFHYYKQENGGVAVARNHGISLGTAPYVCCLDADDFIEPQFLEACVMTLSKHREYGIAYTALKIVTADGHTKVSAWPTQFNYERQLGRYNQIPTCCVFRRVMWERLGGYRSRYCPHGAGSEDAEFWLRAGAYGFNAVMATDAPLFVYSYMTGRVSGSKDYTEIDWTAHHPWTSDMRHPFASIAKPRRQSHPVHQYDNPAVSIIIPVGPNHRRTVFDALDSLESQTYRDWEAVVVDDSGSDEPWEFDGFPDPWRAYPYARIFKTEGKKGAGVARNLGAQKARAPFLLFLDADDALTGEALEEMVTAWGIHQKIIYSDYAGKCYIEKAEVDKHKERVLFYDEKTKLAVLRHNSADYECERAIREPSKDLYIWNLISSLVPKTWHDEIGGFDENMSAWEDWDYWIRMAHAGKCFFRIDKPLVVYRFYTGTRREQGMRDYENLIKYMQDIYRKEKIMPCNCGGKARSNTVVKTTIPTNRINKENEAMNQVNDDNFVLVYYDHPNRGQHKVIGAATHTNYGYRGAGDKFYVHRKDIAAQPNIYKVIDTKVSAPQKKAVAPPAPAPVAPKPMVSSIPIDIDMPTTASPNIMESEDISLDAVPGITPSIRGQLNAAGVYSIAELLELGEEGLLNIKGVGKNRAVTINAFAKDYLEKHTTPDAEDAVSSSDEPAE